MSPLLSLIRICRSACSEASAGDTRFFEEIIHMLESSGVAEELYDLADGLDIMDRVMKREYGGRDAGTIGAGGEHPAVGDEQAVSVHSEDAAEYEVLQERSAEIDGSGYDEMVGGHHEHHEPHDHHTHHGHHDQHAHHDHRDHDHHGHGHHGHYGSHGQHAHHEHHGDGDSHAHHEHHGHHHHQAEDHGHYHQGGDHGHHGDGYHSNHDQPLDERAFAEESPAQHYQNHPAHAGAINSDTPYAAASRQSQGGFNGPAHRADFGPSEAEHARQRAEYLEQIESLEKIERDHERTEYDDWIENDFPGEHK
ncbi:hypothetical protein MRB53_038872 [Persea americana]|nr:hypothetical protein MRB53_038872 [Persea americana]